MYVQSTYIYIIRMYVLQWARAKRVVSKSEVLLGKVSRFSRMQSLVIVPRATTPCFFLCGSLLRLFTYGSVVLIRYPLLFPCYNYITVNTYLQTTHTRRIRKGGFCEILQRTDPNAIFLVSQRVIVLLFSQTIVRVGTSAGIPNGTNENGVIHYPRYKRCSR